MNKTIEKSLLEQINNNVDNIPVLPLGIMKLLKALNDQDIHYTVLTKEIEKYPTIAIKLLALANSPWSSPQTPITSLVDACARIGLNTVRSICIALSISEAFDPSKCKSFDVATYWISALLNAESASLCAKSNNEICTNTSRTAGLLHNIGLLWLANQRPDETDKALINTSESDLSLSDALVSQLNMNYCHVGSYIAKAMELPKIVTNAISCESTVASVNDNLFITNHMRARELTASVITMINSQDEDDSEDEDEGQQLDPIKLKLIELYPNIELMANALMQ